MPRPRECFGVGGCVREGVARRPRMAGGMGTDGIGLEPTRVPPTVSSTVSRTEQF
jgi:hypothetical protein